MSDLVISHVTKIYQGKGAGRIRALDNVSLSAACGKITAFLGLNGAGKTTLIKIVAGLVLADEGQISFNGMNVGTAAYTAQVGAVFEGNRNIYWRLTPRENLEYFGVLRGLAIGVAKRRAGELIDKLQLSAQRDTIAAKLSRGMQQRLAIGLALVHRPSLLLLDEPTLGVDVENLMVLVGMIRGLAQEGVCVILTSHQMDVVDQLADRIALVSNGRLMALEERGLFMQHSESMPYTLRFQGALDEVRAELLLALGVACSGSELLCPPGLLYEVLRVLEPMKVESLTNQLDLGRVFLQRIKEAETC